MPRHIPMKPEIDVGLAAMGKYQASGQIMCVRDIAEVCGCHFEAIRQIELRALRKIRHRLRREVAEMHGCDVGGWREWE